jgi:catechol 2,3-dioxygenase-like lactoylglutathione lyase family enzyme
MPRPTIRHIALFARDPKAVAEFYRDVFEMEITDSREKAEGSSYCLSDGYLTLVILPQRLDGSAAHGLNHFGFLVENSAEIRKRITDRGLVEPGKRPADRLYAEYRAVDPENNWFDISENGYDRRRAEARDDKQPVSV